VIGFVLLSVPIFGLIALGWVAVKAQLTRPAALEALGAFSLRFAVPALLVRLIACEPLSQSFHPLFFAGYLASGCFMFVLIFVVSLRVQRQSPSVAGARATSATVSNLSFLGPPIVLAFFGQRGAGPLSMAIVAEVMILMSLGAAIMARADSNGVHGGSLIFQSTIYNPVVVAIAAGATVERPVQRRDGSVRGTWGHGSCGRGWLLLHDINGAECRRGASTRRRSPAAEAALA
jgi:malonate transporter and related proteins